ncbi:hypothetical protein Cni_G13867 [Canna indica]|uniref:tRNA:m(4)X modification enzyme TRM13 n=1 Tax=Canna indica TaxID=4628 RepID=A0AAQ3KB25_9LILI|nr:hypothetical protein Cni_G13867 [Canna indica]
MRRTDDTIAVPPSNTSPTSATAGEAEGKEEVKRCQFWLPNKRRFCANIPLRSSRFVSVENLKSHVRICPFKKQVVALESQPYYSKGINSGSSDNTEDDVVDSSVKRNAVLGMSVQVFFNLLAKIKSMHSAISVLFPDSYIIPDACNKWLKQQLDRKLPYQEKHALQQASIIGNIEAFGILRKPKK